MEKAELRKIYLAKQKNLSPIERTQKSSLISEKFFANFDLTEIKFLHCFLPIEKFNEIETRLILQIIRRDFSLITILAPRVDFQTDNLESVIFTAQTEFVKNTWEIYEPLEGEIVSAEKIDLVLIPLLVFDERGFRVGYGKGFYDRFLKKCRADCLKIGLSYFAPTAEISDAQDFDVCLDFCVTPEKVWQF